MRVCVVSFLNVHVDAKPSRFGADSAGRVLCNRLCDVTGDGDPKLLVADQNRKLRLYKGINLMSEHALVCYHLSTGALVSSTLGGDL